ncbi:23S rRNA (adenine(2503)-C(2))-methyltransferase RlmN [bacterium]|nr:23S rRNA (adenine(2503)-C(2))-methyltransferase RlmN [bacterium]
MSPKKLIYDLTQEQIRDILKAHDVPKFTAKQIFSCLYAKSVFSPMDFSNISKSNRELIANIFDFTLPEIVKKETDPNDKTVKYLLRTSQGRAIETVVMDSLDHKTQCISTQDGCALGCDFCLTGNYGFKGDLSPGEIVSQVLISIKNDNIKPKNLVFMGMGEPLMNVDNVIRSVEILSHEEGLDYGMRRIIISTVGILKPLKKLLNRFPKIGIAISLNGVPGERGKLMPVEKTHPIVAIINFYTAHREYRRPTFEYVLIKGVNSSTEDAEKLLNFVEPVRCKINLIPYNENPNLKYRPPSEVELNAFIRILNKGRNAVTVRRSKGKDISGACGQLSGESLAE